jgi:trimeric autotransporter adhesin
VQKTKYLKLMPAQLSVPSSSNMNTNTNGRRVTRSLSSSDPGTFRRCRDTLQTSFDKTHNEDGVSNTDVDLVSPERAKVKGCVNNGSLGNQHTDIHNQHDNPDGSVQRVHPEPITLINDSDSDSDSDFKVPLIALNHSATRTNIAERNRLELAAETSRRMNSVAETVDMKAADIVSSQTIDDVEPLAYTPMGTVVLTDSEESTAEQTIAPEINEVAEFINIDSELNEGASNVCLDESVNSSVQAHETSNEPATHTSTSTTSRQEVSIEVAVDSAPLKSDLTIVKPISTVAAVAVAVAVGPVPIRKSPLSSMTSSLNTSSTDNIPPLTAQRPAPRIPIKILPPTSRYSRARSNSSSSNSNSSSSSRIISSSSSSSNTYKSVTEGLSSGNPSCLSDAPISSVSSSASNGGNGCLQGDFTDKASSTDAVSDTSLSPSVTILPSTTMSLKRTHSESAAPTESTSSLKTHKLPSHGSSKQTNKIDLTDDS